MKQITFPMPECSRAVMLAALDQIAQLGFRGSINGSTVVIFYSARMSEEEAFIGAVGLGATLVSMHLEEQATKTLTDTIKQTKMTARAKPSLN